MSEQMLWVVLSEDPKPDDYIAILIRTSTQTMITPSSLRCQTFKNEQDAIAYAKELKNKYGAKSLRIFYPEGHSKNLNR